MDLSFALPHGSQGSEGGPECIFFTLDTYQETFISEICYPTAETGFSFRTDGRTEDGRTAEGQTDVEVEIVI